MIMRVARPDGDDPQAECLREIYELLRRIDSQAGTLSDLVPYFTGMDQKLQECLAMLEMMAGKNDRLTRELAGKLRLIRQLGEDIDAKSREGKNFEREQASLQRILATVHRRVAWHEDRYNKTRGKEELMSSNTNGQRNLPMWAVLISTVVAACLGYVSDAYVAPLSFIETHTHIVVAWLVFVALLAGTIWFVIKLEHFGNGDIPIGNGEPPNGEIHAAETERDTAQTALTAASAALTAAEQERMEAHGAVQAAEQSFDGVHRQLHDAAVAASVDPAAAVPVLITGIQDIKARDGALEAARTTLRDARGRLHDAEQEVNRLRTERDEAQDEFDEKQEAVDEAKSKLKPPRSINVYQIRLVIAIIFVGACLFDLVNVNYIMACARVQAGVQSTFWTSKYIDDPKVSSGKSQYVVDGAKLQLGNGGPVIVDETATDGIIRVYTRARLGEGVDWNRVRFLPMGQPENKDPANKK